MLTVPLVTRYHPAWMRLDKAAKIYPAVQSEELTSVFSVIVLLRQRVELQCCVMRINKQGILSRLGIYGLEYVET